MNKHIKRYVEEEIRNIHITRKEIERLRNDILFGTPTGDGNGRSGEHSDATGMKGIALASNRALQRMDMFVKTFDEVFQQLPEDKQRMIELLYWSNRDLNCDGVGREIGVNGSTVGRWRNAIIKRVAELNGLIV